MEAIPDLSQLQAFKNVSLQMMIDQTFTFRRVFLKKIQVLTFYVNGQSGSGTLLPLPASASTKFAASIAFASASTSLSVW